MSNASFARRLTARCPECPDNNGNRPWAKVYSQRAHSYWDGMRYWVGCGTGHREEVFEDDRYDSPPPPPPPSLHGPQGFDVHIIDTNPLGAYLQVEVKLGCPTFHCNSFLLAR